MPANILVFGDSISFGLYDKKGGWVDRLKRYCINKDVREGNILNKFVYNLSISGETGNEIVKRFGSETVPRNWNDRPTIFLFAFGINDPIIINGKDKVPENIFKNNLIQIIKTCKKYSKIIIFVGPTLVDELKVSPMPWSQTEVWQNKRILKYNKTMKMVCEKQEVEFVDMVRLFNNNNFSIHLADGAHPNTKGHKLIFETVKNYLEKKKYI